MMCGPDVLLIQMQLREKNRDSKDVCIPVSIQQAIINLYKQDKSYVAKYLAAASGSVISYNSRSTSAKVSAAESRKKQRQKSTSDESRKKQRQKYTSDKQALHGRPDKQCHFKAGQKR